MTTEELYNCFTIEEACPHCGGTNCTYQDGIMPTRIDYKYWPGCGEVMISGNRGETWEEIRVCWTVKNDNKTD